MSLIILLTTIALDSTVDFELYTELAAQTINYKVYSEYKTEPQLVGASVEPILNPYFSIKVVQISQLFYRNIIKYDSFRENPQLKVAIKYHQKGGFTRNSGMSFG